MQIGISGRAAAIHVSKYAMVEVFVAAHFLGLVSTQSGRLSSKNDFARAAKENWNFAHRCDREGKKRWPTKPDHALLSTKNVAIVGCIEGSVGDLVRLERPMTGKEFRSIRLELGLNLKQFGRALAYEGKTPDILVSQMEGGGKPIPAYIARLAEALELLGPRKIPKGWIK